MINIATRLTDWAEGDAPDAGKEADLSVLEMTQANALNRTIHEIGPLRVVSLIFRQRMVTLAQTSTALRSGSRSGQGHTEVRGQSQRQCCCCYSTAAGPCSRTAEEGSLHPCDEQLLKMMRHDSKPG